MFGVSLTVWFFTRNCAPLVGDWMTCAVKIPFAERSTVFDVILTACVPEGAIKAFTLTVAEAVVTSITDPHSADKPKNIKKLKITNFKVSPAQSIYFFGLFEINGAVNLKTSHANVSDNVKMVFVGTQSVRF